MGFGESAWKGEGMNRENNIQEMETAATEVKNSQEAVVSASMTVSELEATASEKVAVTGNGGRFSNDMTLLAVRLKTAMAKMGMTQAQLARACGVKPSSVSGWLNSKAKYLKGKNLLAAARALNVFQDWLATGEGAMCYLMRVTWRFRTCLPMNLSRCPF